MPDGGEADREVGLAEFRPDANAPVTGGPTPADGQPNPAVSTMPTPAVGTPDPGLVGGPDPKRGTPHPGITTMAGGGGQAKPAAGFGTSKADDPEELRTAGNGANSLAGELKTWGDTGAGALSMAGQSFLDNDWSGELGGAFVTANERWEKQVGELRSTCLQLHQSCTATADNYTTTETANSDSIKSLSDFG